MVVAIATAHVNRVHLVLADRAGRNGATSGSARRWSSTPTERSWQVRLPASDEALAIAEVDPERARCKDWGEHNDLLGDRRGDVYPL